MIVSFEVDCLKMKKLAYKEFPCIICSNVFYLINLNVWSTVEHRFES